MDCAKVVWREQIALLFDDRNESVCVTLLKIVHRLRRDDGRRVDGCIESGVCDSALRRLGKRSN
jgi:hypothetical protein